MLVRFGGILFVIALAVWLYCVLDAITADRERVRNLPKGVWIAIVLLFFEIGAVAWLVAGRPRGPAPDLPYRGARGAGRGPSGPMPWPTSGSAGRRGGRPAPDDDPEFLARLEREAARDHERLLGSWEEDLRRREEELRRQRNEDDEPGTGSGPPPKT